MKQNARSISIMLLVLVLICSPLLLAPFVSALRRPSQQSTNIFFNYEDSTLFGADYPVAGLDYVIKDGAGTVLLSGTTDATGMVSLQIRGNYDQSGLGVHIEYMWQGVAKSLNNLFVGDYQAELKPFSVGSYVYWSDASGYFVGDAELWFDGSYLTTKTLASGDTFNIAGLIAGTYEVRGIFTTVEFTILVTQSETYYQEDIFVSAEMSFKKGMM